MRKYKSKIFLLLFLLFTIFSVVWAVNDEDDEEPKVVAKEEVQIKKKDTSKDEKVIVDVKGAVNSPGVYELTNKNNVNDAISVAGGLTQYSDTSNINLSKKLTDEMVIIVYSKEEIRKMNESKEVVCPPVNNACIEKKDEKAILEDIKEDSSIININTASKEQLLNLSGVGEAKAEAIISYREKNGKFEKIEDIKNVSGIGDSLFEKIKDQITV